MSIVDAMAGLRISQLARATGFPPTTLRYYETVGLLAPGRDPNGYRRYGEADADLLRFVGQAKRLGLRLTEIAELVALRAEGTCPPVRTRLAGLVNGKLRDTQRSIAELGVFAAELTRLASQFAATDPPEMCGDGCGCLDHPIELSRPPAPPPAACSLDSPDSAQLAARRAKWRALAATACGSEPTGRGWRLRFPADPALATRAAGLAAAERDCCPFLEFTLAFDRDGLTLDVRAPADARLLVAGLFDLAAYPGPAADTPG
jgi:MerR family copper efflux transcriptional regulator